VFAENQLLAALADASTSGGLDLHFGKDDSISVSG
jgi:hypothetical protein